MLYLKNAKYIDPYTFEVNDTDILVESGDNGKIKFADGQIPDNTEVLDCKGAFVTKSFVVGHHHAYSALATGMPQPSETPQNFKQILEYIWWNLDKKLDQETIEISAYITAIQAAYSGATFIIDHHASPFAVENSLETIAKAFDKVGISHLLCYEISDRDGVEIAEKGLAETENYLKNRQALVGLHALFTVSDSTLKKAVDIAEKYNSGIHIHVAEDKIDQEINIEKYGKTVVERLSDFGVLNLQKTILAHAIHIGQKERNILKNSVSFVVQNPDSNLNNQVGFFTSQQLSEDRIMLGTDGMHSDMIKSAQTAYFAGKIFDSPAITAVYNRLRNNHKYLKMNGFYGDGDNNLIVLDYPVHTELSSDNFLGHFFYALNKSHIKHVISNGKFIVKDKKITTVDEKEIYKISQNLTKKLWSKL